MPWKKETEADWQRVRAIRREWYRNNAESEKNHVRRRKLELQTWFNEFKATLKCNRCPENDPDCLDFHHTDSSTKDLDLASAPGRGWSRERILREVAKCEVLCANCHRKHHAKEKKQQQ